MFHIIWNALNVFNERKEEVQNIYKDITKETHLEMKMAGWNDCSVSIMSTTKHFKNQQVGNCKW